MSSLRVVSRDHPKRSLALLTPDFALIFQHYSPEACDHKNLDIPRCLVEFQSRSALDLTSYRVLRDAYGTLGLVALNGDVFLCVISSSARSASVRPGESVFRIENVEFYCVNRSEYEYGPDYESGIPFATEETNQFGLENRDIVTEHPFLALKKLLSDGTFYYSSDFNLTDRLQDRFDKPAAFDIECLDGDMLWNSYMINPLLLFRSHLPPDQKESLDSSKILTCVIRGFASTLTIPASVPLLPQMRSNFPSTLTIISRQSSRRAGTRFNSRGIDDDGNPANFVETEVVLWCPPKTTFSYVQVRGSVPIFWEQTAGFLPGQQKIEITRSFEATEQAFDKHFESLELKYGAVHVVNLLSKLKPGEAELSARYREHLQKKLRQPAGDRTVLNDSLLKITDYDFNAETRGPQGYAASEQIKNFLVQSLDAFSYFLLGNSGARTNRGDDMRNQGGMPSVILQQHGVFRTNCLDCLDRTNLVQTIISLMALRLFFLQHGNEVTGDFQTRHATIWADNGDALSRIYAGTGALKSSFTRHGKMSLAGALADVRKSATRLYVNNFTDNARQRTIDLLLGQLMNQVPVHLYDSINDLVSEDLSRKAAEYTVTKPIKLWVGTFNVNGRDEGPGTDLTPWLFPKTHAHESDPMIFAVGFQEIVDLSPQQIMSTDPTTRKAWEKAVNDCLNDHCQSKKTGKYVLLRTGQLVGAALLIYVKEDALGDIKNVEGSVKKTGLSGIAGNKGACAIRFDICSTRICFVTAHLAAGFADYDERNKDYETIHDGLRFQKNRRIEDHDTVIWLGDFNYRIGLSNHMVRGLVVQNNFDKLYEHDQLNLQMTAGKAFQFYSEGPITFPPTYKYDLGTNDYDTSDKNRIPAWCDRILWRGTNLRQTHYSTADLRISDHRPVLAYFNCEISSVDEGLKSQLQRKLYEERRSSILESSNLLLPGDAQEGKIAQTKSIGPAVPTASTDRKKWWFDNGAPAKSQIKPPQEGFVPNFHRTSNPFSDNGEDDWVPSNTASGRKVQGITDDKKLTKPPLSQKPKPDPGSQASQVASRLGDPSIAGKPISRPTTQRKPKGTSDEEMLSKPRLPPRLKPFETMSTRANGGRDSSVAGNAPNAGASSPSRPVKSPPPPVPKKPTALRSKSSEVIIATNTATASDAGDQSGTRVNEDQNISPSWRRSHVFPDKHSASEVGNINSASTTAGSSKPVASDEKSVHTGTALLDNANDNLDWKPLLPNS